MGITIRCKKTNRAIDLGAGGFSRLRRKVAELAGEPWASHYAKLDQIPLFDPERTQFCDAFDQQTEELIAQKRVPVKVVDFCMQPDTDGRIRYGACKQIYEIVKDYDDDVLYGYAGRQDCAKFADFKAILKDCIETKSDMVWW